MQSIISSHIFINRSTDDLVLCVFLFKDILFNIDCWLINMECTANGAVTHAWIKGIQDPYFLSKAHHSLPVLWNMTETKNRKELRTELLQWEVKKGNHEMSLNEFKVS